MSLSLPKPCAVPLALLSLAAALPLSAQTIVGTDGDVPATMDTDGTAGNPNQYIIGADGPVHLDYGSASVRVGPFSSYNELYIRSGSTVSNMTASAFNYVGFQSYANHNLMHVSGPGTTYSTNFDSVVGFHGTGNRLVIENGATVNQSHVTIGYSVISHGNSASVSGAGTTWNTSSLTIGSSGQNNRLEITGGASVNPLTNIRVGSADAAGNSILVSGEGSSLRHNSFYGVSLGSGGDNTLTIVDGALVASNDLSSANADGSIGNIIALDGGFLAVQYNQVAVVEALILSGGIRLWDVEAGQSIVGDLGNFSYFYAGGGVEGEALALAFTGYSGLGNYTLLTTVPEPSTVALITGTAVLALALGRRVAARRKVQAA